MEDFVNFLKSNSQKPAAEAVPELIDYINNNQDEVNVAEIEEDVEEDFETFPHAEIADTRVAGNQMMFNVLATWQFTTPQLLFPSNLKALQNCVRYAKSKNKRLRATGSRHSYSNIISYAKIDSDGATAPNDGFIVDLSLMHQYNPDKHDQTVDSVDQSSLELLRLDKQNYFDVPGGMKIRMVNTILYPAEKGTIYRFGKRRMPNMGGGDVQAFAGAFSTGTHGSGGKASALHDFVSSILLVSTDGKLFRIEPTAGITDPFKHNNFYAAKADDDKVTLVQNDDDFNAALVSMGSFGIIHSVIIETLEMIYLHEDIFHHDGGADGGWNSPAIKAAIGQKVDAIVNDNTKETFYYILINPYKIGKNLYSSCNERIISPTTDTQPKGNASHRNRFPSFLSHITLSAESLRQISNALTYPRLNLLETSLKATADNPVDGRGRYTDIAYKVWNTGSGVLKTLGTGIEFAFPYDKNNIYAVMDLILAALASYTARGNGYYLNSPVALRFVKSSNAFMAPNYRFYNEGGVRKSCDLWCFFEFTRIRSIDEQQDKMEDELYEDLQTKLRLRGGRVHWGLNFNYAFSTEQLADQYPELEKWKEICRKYNSDGTFDGLFTDQIELRKIAVPDLSV